MRIILLSAAALALMGCSTESVDAYRSLKHDAPATYHPVQTAAAAPAKASATAGDPNKLICKRVSKMGSNFPEKVCSTAAEWEIANAKAKAQADAISDDLSRTDGTTTVGRARE